MTVIIAGERSGVGKTTVTLSLLAYLCRLYSSGIESRSIVQSFKVGPDYIDPMFHRYVTGRPCRNLDPILTSEDYVQCCFARHVAASEFALIEGVMGVFDGASGADDVGSTAHIARLLQVPVVLVLDCSRLSRSVGAIAHGFKTFDPSLHIAGWVLNRVGSDRHLTMLQDALKPMEIPIVGVIHRETDITLPDRHLGLVPTDELSELDGIVDRLAQLGKDCFDWDVLLPLLACSADREEATRLDSYMRLDPPKSPLKRGTSKGVPPFSRGARGDHSEVWLDPSKFPLTRGTSSPVPPFSREARGDHSEVWLDPPKSPRFAPLTLETRGTSSPVPPFSRGARGDHVTRIAVARDRAFNFYYADNLEMLTDLGAEVVEWSPLSDMTLPPDVSGLYLGGGFPEMCAAELSGNSHMREAVNRAIAAGLPTYAECGGLMYLCDTLVDFEGTPWPMVGIIPTTVRMGAKLTLGYRRAIAQHDSPLLERGDTVWGHEFHRSTLDQNSKTPFYELRGYSPDRPTVLEGWSLPNLHASYVHLHWGDRPDIPQRFITHCQIWASRLSNGATPVENG
ncbi:MAG: cobyrinate a,c-diamide synthase [Leptolyngbyaceae bacterium]|nr:cobyrinate a,c-diamide synthase [Leptolyngbyaceae bacterium]